MRISFNRGYCPHGVCGQQCKERQKLKVSYRSDGTKYKNPNSDFKGGCLSCGDKKCCDCGKECLFDKAHWPNCEARNKV